MIWIGVLSNPWCRRSTLALAGALLVAGCSPGAPPPTESQVLAALAADGAQPSLARLAAGARRLADSARHLCEQPDAAGLAQARGAWREAYLAWRRAAPFLFGPADDLGLKRRIGAWPVNAVVLDGVVTSAQLRGLRGSADVRGFAAAEYLLFVPADAPAATAAERCVHLRDLTEEIADLSAGAQQQWEGAWGRSFVAAGDGEPFLIPNEALSLAAAEALNVTEGLLRDRIGTPSGFFQAAAKPDLLEAWRSGSTRDGLLATMDGLRDLVVADGRTGLAGLVATKDGLVSPKDPALAADLGRQLDRAVAELGTGDQDLYAQLQAKPSRLKGLYRDIQRLQDQLVQATLVLELDVRSQDEMHQH